MKIINTAANTPKPSNISTEVIFSPVVGNGVLVFVVVLAAPVVGKPSDFREMACVNVSPTFKVLRLTVIFLPFFC